MFFSSLARGIDDVASMYKYNIILANSDENNQKEVQVVNTLLAKQVDGLIYMGRSISDDLRSEFARSKTPVVLAGSVDPDEQLASVNIDYVAAVQGATKQLLDAGNKKIALVTGPLSEPISGQYRLRGYKQALDGAGIAYDESLVFETEYSYQAGLAVFKQIQKAGATAALISDDEMAVGVLNAALDAGVRVPEDFQIITSNNTKLTQMTRPQLTSLDQPLYDIGAVAMRLLTKLMNKEGIDEITVRLGFDITERQTTK
jgi:LacI family transcriptional regulator